MGYIVLLGGNFRPARVSCNLMLAGKDCTAFLTMVETQFNDFYRIETEILLVIAL